MASETLKPQRTGAAVASRIETLILEGSLRPDESLLGERELAERLGVSRPVLREGLQLLEDRGTVVKGPSGAQVAKLGTSITDPLVTLLANSPVETTFDYLTFREICEGSAAQLAAMRGTAIDHSLIGACMQRIEAAHNKHDPGDEAEADADFHIAIYEATHNVVLLHVMRSLSSMLRSGVFYSREKLYNRHEVRELFRNQHLAIHDAIIARSPDAAARAASGHLQFTHNALKEITEAEERLSVSLRRIGDGNMGLGRGARPAKRT